MAFALDTGREAGIGFASTRPAPAYVRCTRNRAGSKLRESAAHHLAERFLHLASERVPDITHHVIADQGYRRPANYRDTMAVLAEEGILAVALAERLKSWMGFRNALVHFYVNLDHGRPFDAIRDDLHDLADFARAVAPLLDAKPG